MQTVTPGSQSALCIRNKKFQGGALVSGGRLGFGRRLGFEEALGFREGGGEILGRFFAFG